MSGDPHLVALLGLPELGPVRLHALLDCFGEPARAWEAVRRGALGGVPLRSATKRDELVAGWRSAAALVDVDDLVRRHAAAGVTVLDPTSPDWPQAFVDDPEPPPLVFVAGDTGLLSTVSVAVVGTRRCTAAGVAVARELGEGLAAAGVGVVSGLALGIDGAAQRAALDAGGPVVGVVATGLDVVYPRRHRELWRAVGDHGVLVSEAPLGTPAERWRFPARNRLIAALSRLVVVVESRRTGGSMHTVQSALERGVDVYAVPGSVSSPASAGPNQLLFEGCGVVRDAADVLATLGWHVPSSTRAREPELPLVFADDPIVRALDAPATSLDDIVAVTGLPFGEVAARLATLEIQSAVVRVDDGYRPAVG